jgi:hypothetical protein
MNDALTLPDLLDDPATRDADAQAVMDRLISGKALDSAVTWRARSGLRKKCNANSARSTWRSISFTSPVKKHEV